MITTKKKPELTLPIPNAEVLLHSCCAPCSCAVMENLIDAGIKYTVFFYNPNIHPKKEYEYRKNENKEFAALHNIPFVDVDYDRENWFLRVKGMEHLPERGERCTVCFDMRLERTALYASEHGFKVFTSALAASRMKDIKQVNDSGLRAANRYQDLIYWTHDWKKAGNQPRMIEIAKEENFYRQEYCGCAFSLRDSNDWRVKNGRERIQIGIRYANEASNKINIDKSSEATTARKCQPEGRQNIEEFC